MTKRPAWPILLAWKGERVWIFPPLVTRGGGLKQMLGELSDPDDLEWLVAWIKSRAGDQMEIARDNDLDGMEFVADDHGLRLSWYGFEVLRSGVHRTTVEQPADGWWVGPN